MDGRNHPLWLYLAAQMLFAALGMEHSQAVNSGVQCGFLGCWQALGHGILLLQRQLQSKGFHSSAWSEHLLDRGWRWELRGLRQQEPGSPCRGGMLVSSSSASFPSPEDYPKSLWSCSGEKTFSFLRTCSRWREQKPFMDENRAFNFDFCKITNPYLALYLSIWCRFMSLMYILSIHIWS